MDMRDPCIGKRQLIDGVTRAAQVALEHARRARIEDAGEWLRD